MSLNRFLAGTFLLLLLAVNTGCQTTYFKAWEKLGYHKRDILVDTRPESPRHPAAAKEQFQTTLEPFQSRHRFSKAATSKPSTAN